MRSIRKRLLIITIGIMILYISINIPIISTLLYRITPRSYGKLVLAFQVEEKENPDIIVEITEFTLEVQYDVFEREQYDKHLEFIYEIHEKWKAEDYVVKVLWISDTVQNHYWLEKLDDNTLTTFHSGLLSNGTKELNNGNYYNLTCWELGTGPDPRIG